MESGPWITRLASSLLLAAAAAWPVAAATPHCVQPLYLTFDTGHMGVADLVADTLRRHDVRVTFFVANEKTLGGGGSLDAHWAPWWRARAAEGHAFASHTWDHVYWRADLRSPGGETRFRVRPAFGPQADQLLEWSAVQYCEELRRPALWLSETAGVRMLPLFRAPGGKTSAALVAAAQRCGWRHVGWSPAGFLGDELSSETHPNPRLLAQALRDIRAGDILLAHLGIWSRKDAWAPAVLEPLIAGLKQRGFCFLTLAEHPDHRAWIAGAATLR